MTDYKAAGSWRSELKKQRRMHALRATVLGVLGILIYGYVGYLEQEPPVVPDVVPVVKSVKQVQIETILPPPVAHAIAERSSYPLTMSSIAHTESRGNPAAVGDGGKARGMFQVWPSLHGDVPDSIEGQVDQANRLFLQMVEQYGYREAVARWNGSPSNPKVQKYRRVVMAKIQELEAR